MKDLESEQSDEQLRETAGEMPVHYFLGEELKPFSFGRQTACQRMLTGDTLSTLESSTMLVFICTLDRPDLERTRKAAGRDLISQQMEAWAEGKGINLRSHAGQEVVRVADEIWKELEASEFEPKPKKDQLSKESAPPNG